MVVRVAVNIISDTTYDTFGWINGNSIASLACLAASWQRALFDCMSNGDEMALVNDLTPC